MNIPGIFPDEYLYFSCFFQNVEYVFSSFWFLLIHNIYLDSYYLLIYEQLIFALFSLRKSYFSSTKCLCTPIWLKEICFMGAGCQSQAAKHTSCHFFRTVLACLQLLLEPLLNTCFGCPYIAAMASQHSVTWLFIMWNDNSNYHISASNSIAGNLSISN